MPGYVPTTACVRHEPGGLSTDELVDESGPFKFER